MREADLCERPTYARDGGGLPPDCYRLLTEFAHWRCQLSASSGGSALSSAVVSHRPLQLAERLLSSPISCLNPMYQCDPSQNGLLRDPPQRQSA